MNKKDGIYWGDRYRIQRAEEIRERMATSKLHNSKRGKIW
jgi:hypothetical protein